MVPAEGDMPGDGVTVRWVEQWVGVRVRRAGRMLPMCGRAAKQPGRCCRFVGEQTARPCLSAVVHPPTSIEYELYRRWLMAAKA